MVDKKMNFKSTNGIIFLLAKSKKNQRSAVIKRLKNQSSIPIFRILTLNLNKIEIKFY
jgi:hypothetical protein